MQQSQMRVAIMCAEKDPLQCHRTFLIAYFACQQGFFDNVIHLIDKNTIEDQKSAETRLLKEEQKALDKHSQMSLFDTQETSPICQIEQAYFIRRQKISPVYESLDTSI